MADYKSQHYVPRSYLADFVDQTAHNRQLWVYERGKSGPYRRAPKKVAANDYYYSFEGPDGTKDHGIEQLLGKTEAKAIPILRALAQGLDPSDIGDEDRQWVSAFLSFMSVRVPGFRENVESSVGELMRLTGMMAASKPEYFERTLREAAKAAGKELAIDPEKVRQAMLSGEYKVRANPTLSLRLMASLGPRVAPYIYNFEWRVLTATDGNHFITSDRPLVLAPTMPQPAIYGMSAGWETPYMEATFPLAPNACLLISVHHPAGREVIAPAQVAEINLRTAAYAHVAIYSSRQLDPRTLAPPPGWKWWSPVTSAVRQDVVAAIEGKDE